MRIAAAAVGLVLLLTVAMLARRTEAASKPEDEARAKNEAKISTSLKLDNATLAKKGFKVRQIVTSVSMSSRSSSGAAAAPAAAPATSAYGELRARPAAGDNATRQLSAGDKVAARTDEDPDRTDKPEELPEALELRYVKLGKPRRRPYYALPTRRHPDSIRRNVYNEKPSRSPARGTRRPPDPKRAPTENECTFFSKTVCLEAADYPIEAIMRSIRSNKEMVAALLADFKVHEAGFADDEDPPPRRVAPYKPVGYDALRYNDKRYENRFESGNEIKRKFEFNGPFDNVEEGYTCPSHVKYARPQLARAASGVWKYIINTGEHTQTLRLEKCTNPHASCSFISENYRSSCVQVYNYHRLLTWDSKLGLHMDIFKVPSCCSCHVHGYADLYPPHQTDPPLKAQELFPGADFASGDHHVAKGSSQVSKYTNSLDSSALNLFRENYGSPSDLDEAQLQHSGSSRRPSLSRPPRPRKPSSSASRPFDKLPQQHAPNTRAPGYKGPRPYRPTRPFRRESSVQEATDFADTPANLTISRLGSPFQQEALDPSTRLHQNGGYDEEFLASQDQPQKRINYNYHPIIDFFKPEAAMLKSEEPMQASASAADRDSWKPIFKA